MVGVGRMSQFGGAATALITAFTDRAILAPYRALQPKQPLTEMNQPNAYRAKDALALKLDRPGDADEAVLNDILWHASKGADASLPTIKTAFRIQPLRDDDCCSRTPVVEGDV